MTVTPNDLIMEKINPKLSEKFSPNLYKWLNSRSNKHRRWASRVYRDLQKTLWIGFIDDGDFIGCRLMSVLCNGTKATTGCHLRLSNELTEIDDFWVRYMEIGRCAIDTDHSMYFVGDQNRWAVTGEARECQWCGQARQYLKKWVEPVQQSEWVAV